MIVSAYGLPGLTCVELALMFNNLGINYGLVRRQKLTRITNNVSKIQPIFPVVFSSGSMFLRTQGKFKTAKVVAFVLDNPIVLTKNLDLPLLGAEYLPRQVLTFNRVDEDKLKEILLRDTSASVSMTFSDLRYKPVEETLKKYEQSDLSYLQTFLYKIKDVDTRDKVSSLTKNWLLTSLPYSTIEGKLHRYLKPAIAETLKTMLTTPSVDNLRVAIRQVKTNKLTPAKAAKKYKISSFDLRFLLADRK